MTFFAALIDESVTPPLRETLGFLLSRARTADIALRHLRLAGLNLRPAELANLERCRLLLGQLDAEALFAAGIAGRSHVHALARFAASGRLAIASAPHHVWNPDFSVFCGLPGDRSVTLVGAHYFGRPYPMFGTAFTCVFTEPGAVRRSLRRFERLWASGHDVLPAVAETLDRLLADAG